MPILDLTTNVKPTDEKAFVLAFSKAAAEALDRPEEYVQVNVTYNPYLCNAGTLDPSVQLHLAAIGRLGVTQNQTIGDKLKIFFEEQLSVPKSRSRILYYDPDAIFH